MKVTCTLIATNSCISRSQRSRGLRRGSAAARLLRLWVRIPPGTCISVSRECCVLSGRGLCDELITRPEESYRLWCVVVCDLQTSCIKLSQLAFGSQRQKKKKSCIVNQSPLSLNRTPLSIRHLNYPNTLIANAEP